VNTNLIFCLLAVVALLSLCTVLTFQFIEYNALVASGLTIR